MKTKYDEVTLGRERTIHLADHEILLSFLHDDGAEFFEEWWQDAGSHAFKKWLDKRETEDQ
jgi:hypothetical protein